MPHRTSTQAFAVDVCTCNTRAIHPEVSDPAFVRYTLMKDTVPEIPLNTSQRTDSILSLLGHLAKHKRQ